MNAPTITLRSSNPFYDLFPNGIAPVQAPLPGVATLITADGDQVQAIYMLDASRLDSEQMEAVAGRVAELFSARVNDIRDELIENGLPIRASEVAVHPAIDLRIIL